MADTTEGKQEKRTQDLGLGKLDRIATEEDMERLRRRAREITGMLDGRPSERGDRRFPWEYLRRPVTIRGLWVVTAALFLLVLAVQAALR